MKPRALLPVLLAAVLAGSIADLATASVGGELEVGARNLVPSGLAADQAFVLAPELRVGTDSLFLRGSGLLRASNGEEWRTDGRMEMGFRHPLANALALELHADGGTRQYPGRPRSEGYRALARLRATNGRVSGFAGGGALRARNEALWTTSRILVAGGTLVWGRFELGLDQQTTRHNMTVTRDSLVMLPDSTFQSRVVGSRVVHTSYTDAGLRLGWRRGRWSSRANVGVRFGDFSAGSRVWVLVTGGYRLTRNLRLTVCAGREPSIPEEGIPAGNVASLGLDFGFVPAPEPVPRPAPPPADAAFSARTIAEGTVLLSIRLSNASRVEIMGDFTDWLPADLSRDREDRWEAIFPLAPGTHRVCMRVDGGAWTAPPGLTEVRDDFGGAVGILVVRRFRSP